MFKNLMRFVAMLAAVIVSADAFAQTSGANSLNALRNRGRQSGAQQSAAANAEGGESTKTENKDIPALNWDAAPVDIVLQAYADQVDKTYLKDPAVPNCTITLKSKEGQKMTQEEYLEAIEVILEMNGIHIEPYGEKFLRVLPRKEVRKEGIPIIMDQDQKLAESGKVVSMMVQLKNISTEDGQKTLDNFKSGSGIIIAFERTNSLLITDTEQNINRMLEIVRAIDVAMPVLENVFVRQIKNASAEDIKTALEAIVAESQKELEKSGNKNAANVAQPGTMNRIGGGLLNRNNQKQSAAPTSNSSVLMQVSDADRGMIRGKVLILADERSNKLVIVTQKPNMDFFDKVIEQLDIETTPDTVVKVYRLKYAEADEVSDMINDLIGNSGSSRSSGKDNQNRNAKSGSGSNITRSNTAVNAQRKPANQRTGDAKVGELTKDNTTVLADERINGLVVMTEKELVPTLEQIIESMDVKLSQVLIETVIVEVTLDDKITTGIDWLKQNGSAVAVSGGGGTQNSALRNTYSASGSSTIPSWMRGHGSDDTISLSMPSDQAVKGLATDAITMLPSGGGLNYFANIDKLNLSVVIQAAKTDNRSKYLASPIVMTLDNKEATINATRMKYLLKGFTSSGNSYSTIAVPDYEQKELGIEIKVKPKINPNGTVMLNVEEKYTQVGANQEIQYASSNGGSGTGSSLTPVQVPTTITREMSADVLLEDGQTVVFGGLTETQTAESESGIPILKDIPVVGRWLFGSVEDQEVRNELLVFMTPYVLDDSESAQAEALRRKKALSTSRPWEDHGWSLSELADPVDQKEQRRRLKEEWKKQDEERKAKIAIETEKIERVNKLEKMSAEERKVWLEMHKKELDEDQKDELEKKMLDEDSQSELRKLVEDVKARKLGDAERAIKKSEEDDALKNERAKIDAVKAKEESKPKEE